MPVLSADLGVWPIFLVWGLIALIGNATKKRRQGQAGPAATGAPPGQAHGGMMDELRRAMEELKRAEMQQSVRTAAPPGSPPAVVSRSQVEVAAKKRIQEQRRAQTRRSVVKRPVRPLDADDDDKSSETGAIEVVDYDAEAETLIQARVKAADRGLRVDVSSEGMSALQQARREGRVDVAIGGAREHAEWHGELGSASEEAARIRPTGADRLKRFADGSVRGAIILSEVLGLPAGQRDR